LTICRTGRDHAAKTRLPDFCADAAPDADRDRPRVENLILARQVKSPGRSVRVH
jgi:hypothetical protein